MNPLDWLNPDPYLAPGPRKMQKSCSLSEPTISVGITLAPDRVPLLGPDRPFFLPLRAGRIRQISHLGKISNSDLRLALTLGDTFAGYPTERTDTNGVVIAVSLPTRDRYAQR